MKNYRIIKIITITYLGLSSGSEAVHWATTRQNESLSSPPARPPIAYLLNETAVSETQLLKHTTPYKTLLFADEWNGKGFLRK